MAKVTEDVSCTELFHGPTLAFKDFGGRFIGADAGGSGRRSAGDHFDRHLRRHRRRRGARLLRPENVRVVILYPQGKISLLQEKLFCTTGGNIHTVAIDGDFDACGRW